MLVENIPGASTTISIIPYGSKPSAHAAIHLNYTIHNGEYDDEYYLIWNEIRFEADKESEVKMLVENWCENQMKEIVALLGGASEFTKP